ncbi:MAG: metallophosphoesterase [Clostridia bacterium]|nr:metallophosphoesterase [Clostridia bacterium]
MKNRLSKVIVIGLLAVLVLCFVACNKNNDKEKANPNNITVFSDIHILASEQYGNTATPGLQRILSSNEKAIGLTEAIFRTAIDDFIASDSPILIITGDLTDDGAKVAHQAVARELARAEAAGKRCYVINGNHDINNRATSYVGETTTDIDNVSPELFAQIYADFGFSEAIARDENSLSYVAELTDKYRLIAFDCAKYDLEPGTDRSVSGRHDPHVTSELLEWLEEQLDQCFFDNKEPFLISHFPILSHVGPLFGSASHVNMQEDTLGTLRGGNVSFSFCGHVHQQDIATYDFGNRNYYEIETGCLSYTTLPIRHFVDDGTTVKITTSKQSYVNADYVPAFYSTEERAAILADLPAYVWEYENGNFAKYMYGKLYMDNILALFGITDENMIEDAEEIVYDFYNMPLYEKDANGGRCLEGICKKYGATDFPVVDGAKTVGEMLAFFIKNNFAGDENVTPDTPQVKQLTYALYAAADRFKETKILSRLGILSEMTEDDAAKLVADLFSTGKAEIVKSGILDIIKKIPKLSGLLDTFRMNKATAEQNAITIRGILENINYFLQNVKDDRIQIAIDSFYDEEKGFGNVLDFSELDENGKAYLNFKGIIGCLFKGVGKGLLQDEGAPDNNFEFPSPKCNAHE